MQDQRMLFLLSTVPEALKHGNDLFSVSWVEEHNVTIAEITQLIELIARILEGFTKAPEEVQNLVLSLAD